MKECYGNIYPDLARLHAERVVRGKVFKILSDTLGMVRANPRLEIDHAAWEECQRCPHYQSCYDFSNAKLAMQKVVSSL
jgi:hypothetical protein